MQTLRFRTTGLLIIAAANQLFLGLSLHILPERYSSPFYDNLRPWFGPFSQALMAAGVILLVMVRYPMPRPYQRALALVSVSPLVYLAVHASDAGLRNAPILWGVLAAAAALAPWLPSDQEGGWRLSLLVLAGLELFMATRILLWPDAFSGPLTAPANGYARAFAILELASGIALFWLKPGLRGKGQIALGVLALLFPAWASWNAWSVGILSGAVTWGGWAAALVGMIGRSLVGSLALGYPDSAAANGESSRQTERLLELWSWGLLLAILAVSQLGAPNGIASPFTINLFVLLVSGYNAMAHFFFPGTGQPDQRVLAHLSFMAVALGFLLSDNGRWALVLSALLVVPPFLATRVRGAAAGYSMLGLVVFAILFFQATHWWQGSLPLSHALIQAAVQIIVIVTAGIVGIRSAAQQHQLVRQLAEARADLQQRVLQQALHARIGRAIHSTLDLDEILTITVNQLGQALQVSRSFIRLRGAYGFLPVIHQYVAPGVFPLSEEHLPNLQLSQVVAEVGHAVTVDDFARNPIWKEIGPVGGTRAAMAAPIFAEGELMGVITFHQCDAPRKWMADEIQFLESVAGHVGMAMAHARAHQELQAQNQELTNQGALLANQARQLEAALQAARTAEEARARLVAIMEATTDFVGLTDRHGKVMHLNRAALAGLGLTGGIEAGLSMRQIFTPEFVRSQLLTALKQAMRQGTWSGEGTIVAAEGRVIPVSLVILDYRDPSGELIFATIARDISAQKATEAALRDSEERFRGAFDFAPIGVGLVDRTGRWLQVNQPLCAMLGYTEAEFLSKTAAEMIDPEDLAACQSSLLEVIDGELPSCREEQRWFHKDGHLVWTSVGISKIKDGGERNPYFVVHVQDVTDRKEAESQLLHLANYDPLTDLFNRRRFHEELERQLANANRYGNQVALLFIDLDQFKYINDSLGHMAGDRMLKSMARLLRSRLREGDAVARLGGDEFAVLLPHADSRQAEAVAQKLLDGLRQHVEIIEGRAVGITGSMGIALYPEHGKTAEELLAYADMAMYRVKEIGRNNFTLYKPDESMWSQWESKLTWETRIREALANNGFMLYQQPIHHCASGRVTRYEALLRMKGPGGELISPGSFLPVAERFGMIHAVDRWVVTEAIRQIAQHQALRPDFCLEVNLSGKALTDSELLPLIKREIARTGINPACLVLEITETAACTDTVLGRQFVHTLQEIGCRFALDDFGSGFSSFSYLKELPVDYLKIDGSFIRNLVRDPVDQQLVRGMIQVARGLGRQTIAECVEDGETLALLQEMGIDYAQGYYIGHPQPMVRERDATKSQT